MVTLKYKMINDGESEDRIVKSKIYKQEFESEEKANEWLRSQSGHPFMYISIVSLK